MKLSDLTPAPYNPRRITPEAASGLAKSIVSFGDISGIVFNIRTGHLVCGHQRVDQLKALYGADLMIEIVATPPSASPSTKTKEAAQAAGALDTYGRIVAPTGEAFSVRMVDWPEGLEMAANVAANNPKIAGEFTPDVAKILDDAQMYNARLFKDLKLDELRVDLGNEGGVLSSGYKPPEPKPGKTDPDDVPEIPKVAITKPGDVWLLGAYYECEVCGRKYDYEVGKDMKECLCDKKSGS